MYKLYIDTTDRNINKVQLIKDEQVLSELVGEIDVVSSIQQVLDQNNLKLSDMHDFEMNEGPGSFTGLKISASIVNALRYAQGKKDLAGLVTPNYTPSKFD